MLFGKFRILGKLALLVLVPLLGVVALTIPIIVNRASAAQDAQDTSNEVQLATRVSTAPWSTVSRYTGSPVAATARLRVVGIPSACMASLMMYSRSIGPSEARPSPRRENRVGPAPFS